MIDQLCPYPAIKATGLPWLATLPNRWEIRRNGRLFSIRKETGFPDLPILEVSLRTGVRVRSFEDGTRKQQMTDRSKYQRALKGDIAYNMRMWQGAVGVVPTDGLVSPAYVVIHPYPGVIARYYCYLFRTVSYMHEIDVYSRGIVPDRNRLYWVAFKQMPSVFPSPEEQQLIVRFLDWHGNLTAKAIWAKRRAINLLEEQQQAITQRAVSQGIGTNVPSKVSGIKRLDEIPAHWDVISIGAASTLVQTGPFGSQLSAASYVKGAIPVINPSHLVHGKFHNDLDVSITPEKARSLARHEIQPDDVIVARRGELGRCAVADYSHAGWICGTGSIIIRPIQKLMSSEFVAALLSTRGMRATLREFSLGSTMDNLNEGMIRRLKVPCPPRFEQDQILSYIRNQLHHSSQAIGLIERQIMLLQEFRDRLIAQVVTGKLDVRQLAESLPETTTGLGALEGADTADKFEDDVEVPDLEEAAA
jgi:type I restriction enzyme S subunit